LVKIYGMPPVPDFLKPLETILCPFPYEAVAEAIERKEEAIPHLLVALEWAADLPDPEEMDPTYMLHLYAIYLLSQFREVRAYPLVDRLLRRPDCEALTGDLIPESGSRILASLCGGDVAPLKALTEDQNLDEMIRSCGVEAMAVLYAKGVLSREEFSGYLGELFASRLEREPSFVWDSLVGIAADLRLVEHLPAIELAFEEGLAVPLVEPLEEVKKEIVLPADAPSRVTTPTYEFIDDAIAELEWWDCFDLESYGDENLESPNFEDEGRGETIVRDAPKIGRNEQCPCGSGKKYKNCCGKLG
jgi:hypothetical protein